MKLLSIIALVASQVMAVTIIPEDVFNVSFSVGPAAIVAVAPPTSTTPGNVTPVLANVTFVGRTVSNTTITDSYIVSSAVDGEIGTATLTKSLNSGFSGVGGGFGGFPYLEIRAVVDLSGSAPTGMEYQTILDGSLVVQSILFVWLDVNPESNVSEIYSEDTGITWRVFPGPMFMPATTDMEFGGVLDRHRPMYHRMFPAPSSIVEITFIGIIPPGSNLINPYDPIIIIGPTLPATLNSAPAANGENLVDNDEDDEDEEDDEEDVIPAAQIISPLKQQA
ncbi:hypothetical protein NEFER03_2076 [Nematocida sp. LUAm3]|nr:hypothetical protein NEFER03_2076 [Nematocida sp. LUAm3]KAI5176206.1 hypothetical protein NEFER02_2012 [Nematocida sp. LUAm2]KAI5179194.1 hypothetical protein NEFER01_2051 [Nematocida sp. LUAm1]